MLMHMILDWISQMVEVVMYRLHKHLFDALSYDSIALAVTVLRKKKRKIFKTCLISYKKCENAFINNTILPLFDRQIRSIPFRCRAIRANSQNDSRMLKSHNGEISKQAILFLDAYSSACFAATCLLNAKCNRFPTNTFGTPGACYN